MDKKQQWQRYDDEILARAYQNGDERALQVLYEKHAPYISRVTYGIVRDRTLVEDVVQNVFLSVFKNIDKLRHEASFKTWLYRIAVNQSLATLKKNKRWDHRQELLSQEVAVYPELVRIEDGPEALALEGEYKKAIKGSLEQLTPKHRIVLMLYYFEDMPLDEIAKVLSIPVGSVKSRLYHARVNLKKLLKGILPKISSGRIQNIG